MNLKSSIIALCLCAFVAVFCCGCESLRFAPTEPQKKVAWQGHVTARNIETEGTDAHSPAARQQVQATQAALTYIGLPKDPVITDYATTVAQAQADAAQRPVIEDISEAAEQGLSLAAELAILFGVGGTGFGGKKVLDWIKLGREKNKALAEIIQGNELFKDQLKTQNAPVLAEFKEAQNKTQKSPSTKRLVTELKT